MPGVNYCSRWRLFAVGILQPILLQQSASLLWHFVVTSVCPPVIIRSDQLIRSVLTSVAAGELAVGGPSKRGKWLRGDGDWPSLGQHTHHSPPHTVR